MSNLIIIRGPLGVGKTTISKHLAERLKGIHIAIDKVLEKHELDKVKGRCIPLQNFIKANKLILPEINKTLAKGKSVIIDGNFYHKGQITHLLKNATQKGDLSSHSPGADQDLHQERQPQSKDIRRMCGTSSAQPSIGNQTRNHDKH